MYSSKADYAVITFSQVQERQGTAYEHFAPVQEFPGLLTKDFSPVVNPAVHQSAQSLGEEKLAGYLHDHSGDRFEVNAPLRRAASQMNAIRSKMWRLIVNSEAESGILFESLFSNRLRGFLRPY
jgi:hypothetical protein